MSELVPQAIRELLTFYTQRCPDVRFGDLDLRVLERAVAGIDEAAVRVLAAEEAVSQARAQFREVETGLLAKANRTLSFLKLFVDDDEGQLAELEAIGNGLPAARRRSKGSAMASGAEPKPRRPRKSKGTDESSDSSATAAESVPDASALDDELGEIEMVDPAPQLQPEPEPQPEPAEVVPEPPAAGSKKAGPKPASK